MGAGILWFGWFGFNGGSALAADGIATSAFVATHLGGMAGLASWIIAEWIHRGKPTTLGAASGAVAGLATITPGAGFVTPNSAIIIGSLAGMICYACVAYKSRLGYDDSLDVVGIHGVGGVIGTLLVGVFATRMVNASGSDGLLTGNPSLILTQLMGIVAVGVYVFCTSWVLLKVIDTLWGLRVSEDTELQGLDLGEHSETAYSS
jgi:Amt family ammonium transporter